MTNEWIEIVDRRPSKPSVFDDLYIILKDVREGESPISMTICDEGQLFPHNATHFLDLQMPKAKQEKPCGTCGSTIGVKAVQIRREMSTEYIPGKAHRCASCRKKWRGMWRYWK